MFQIVQTSTIVGNEKLLIQKLNVFIKSCNSNGIENMNHKKNFSKIFTILFIHLMRKIKNIVK